MHKLCSSDSFPKLCPIVSSIGTLNHNLARFLCDLLSPLVPYDYSCKDTLSFVSQIKNANLSKRFLASYNVTSLFANIPLQETIDIAINLIFNHNPTLNITRKELKKLSFTLHHRPILFLTVSVIIKSMELYGFSCSSCPCYSWVFTNLSGLMNKILTNLNFT